MELKQLHSLPQIKCLPQRLQSALFSVIRFQSRRCTIVNHSQYSNSSARNCKLLLLFKSVPDRYMGIYLQIIHYKPQFTTFPYDTIMLFVNFQCFPSGVYLEAKIIKPTYESQGLSWWGHSPTVRTNRDDLKVF